MWWYWEAWPAPGPAVQGDPLPELLGRCQPCCPVQGEVPPLESHIHCWQVSRKLFIDWASVLCPIDLKPAAAIMVFRQHAGFQLYFTGLEF